VLVIDSKKYRGRLQLDAYGMLWHGRYLLVSALRKVRWEADQADEVLGIADVDVIAIVAVHGASVPWGQVRAGGVTVVPARRVPDLLQASPPILGPEQVARLADRARVRFRSAAQKLPTVWGGKVDRQDRESGLLVSETGQALGACLTG
jgi:hypothetical protein